MIKKNELIKVIVLSILITILFILFLTLVEFETLISSIITYVVVIVWAFNTLPAYLYTYYFLNSKSGEEGFYIGFRLGLVMKFTVFLLPLFGAPYIGYRYFKLAISKSDEFI